MAHGDKVNARFVDVSKQLSFQGQMKEEESMRGRERKKGEGGRDGENESCFHTSTKNVKLWPTNAQGEKG